jgi:hypothetical protein
MASPAVIRSGLYEPSIQAKIASSASWRLVSCADRSAQIQGAKNDSATVLSQLSRTDPVAGRRPTSARRLVNRGEVYWADSTGRRNTST